MYPGDVCTVTIRGGYLAAAWVSQWVRSISMVDLGVSGRCQTVAHPESVKRERPASISFRMEAPQRAVSVMPITPRMIAIAFAVSSSSSRVLSPKASRLPKRKRDRALSPRRTMMVPKAAMP